MSNEFHCKICDILCSGKVPYDQHIASAKHVKKAKPFSNETPTTPSSPTANVVLSSPSTPSASTELSAETMKILLEWKHPRDFPPYCNICFLPLHGDNNVDLHFAETNQLHKLKLTNHRQIQEGSAQYSCKICSEIFSNEFSMINHFQSSSHNEILEEKAKLQKLIKVYEAFQELKKARKETILIENQLENQFKQLTVADASASPERPKKNSLISSEKFQKALLKKLDDDDSDD